MYQPTQTPELYPLFKVLFNLHGCETKMSWNLQNLHVGRTLPFHRNAFFCQNVLKVGSMVSMKF
jgi:hypothetical protein